jgi:hypothetical protein
VAVALVVHQVLVVLVATLVTVVLELAHLVAEAVELGLVVQDLVALQTWPLLLNIAVLSINNNNNIIV